MTDEKPMKPMQVVLQLRSALADRDREIERLQARLKACPTVEQFVAWFEALDMSETEKCLAAFQAAINRMEALNDR